MGGKRLVLNKNSRLILLRHAIYFVQNIPVTEVFILRTSEILYLKKTYDKLS